MLFRGKYAFLSNMYSCTVHDDYGIEYSCVEAAFQAQKTEDKNERIEIACMSGPAAKKAGRRVKLVADWDKKKVCVMRELLKEKFSDPNLMAKLIAVKGEIIEDNTWNDRFWGRCNGQGANMLGKLLMEVRDSQ